MNAAHSTIIKVKGLTKRFNDFTAVDNISFEVNRGEIFAFLGPNGAGKTTTIKILTTLLDRTSRDVTLAGHDPDRNPSSARQAFGIVFQEQSHDDKLTTYENMEYHGVLYGVEKKERRRRNKELLQYVDLWDRRDEYLKNFSGGMKRRMEIARGLIHHPKILFLDEPTLGLDPQTRNYIWKYVEQLTHREEMTVFFTTHYMEEAERNAHRIAIIDQGKIIETGTPNDLKNRTDTDNIEDAFLELTGREIREMNAESGAGMKRRQKMKSS